MRGRTALLAAVAAAAVAGGVGVAAGATSGAAGGTRTLTVIEHADTDTTADTGPKGDSLGDVLAFQNPVYDAKDAKRVGHDLGSCVRTAVGESYECSWTLVVDGGSLVVEGPFLDAGDSTLAITGGTGRYKAARGTMGLHALKGGAEYRFTYRITS